MTLRTWHYESAVVAVFLGLIVVLSTLLTGSDWREEAIGCLALFFAHGRNSIMFRMTEAQAKVADHDPHKVSCWRWAGFYFLAAEACWSVYFIRHGAWAALSGVVVFVGYAQWRTWYTRRARAGA
jgi:hypothetical protein